MTMQVRILLTGLAGGVAMFFWGFVSHELIPLGTAGMTYLADKEDAVMTAVKSNIAQPGLYPFPFLDGKEDRKAVLKRVEEKAGKGQRGMLIVDPRGGPIMTTMNLPTEFATNCISALLAAFLLSQATALTRFGPRVGFVALIGLVGSIAVNLPQWNWYRFPTAFTLAQLVEHVVGFSLVGVAAALIMKPGAAIVAGQPGADP